MAFMFLCETIDVDNVAGFILRRSCRPTVRYRGVHHVLSHKLLHARLCVLAYLITPFSSQFVCLEQLLDRCVLLQVN